MTIPWKVARIITLFWTIFSVNLVIIDLYNEWSVDYSVLSRYPNWSRCAIDPIPWQIPSCYYRADMRNYNCSSLIARCMGPTWDPSGADRPQVGPMWATWKLLSGMLTRPFRQAPFDTVYPKVLCTRLAFCCILLRIYTGRFYTYHRVLYHWNLGPDSYHGASKASLVLYSLRRHRLFRMGIPIINLRRSADRLRFIMRITLPVRWLLYHWNENVVILTKFQSLAALEVVILTTSSAANDENLIKMKTFPFQWYWIEALKDMGK